MILAVAYYRYSSENQREESIFAQRRVVEEYAEKNNIKIIKEYVDEAETAKNDDRPNFLKMVDDIKTEIVQPDYVLVHKLNRYARNRYDAAIYRRIFKNHGAKLISVTQLIDDSPEGVILEAVLDAMAEYQSLDLGREAFKGLKENALQGMHTGGIPALGFDVDKETKKYLLNEKEADIVRFIFESVRKGESYSYIIEECKRRNYKTKRGNIIGRNSIHDILRNEKYYGALVFHKRNNENNSHQFRPRNEWIIVEDALPVIIPKEEWEEVQKIMDGRKKEKTAPKAKGKVPYLLTGTLECGECGSAYVGSNAISGKGKTPYYYYTCSGKKRLNNCQNKNVSKEPLESFVLDSLVKIFSTENIKELAGKIELKCKELISDTFKETEYLNKELERLNQQINRFLDAFAEGELPANIAGPKLKMLDMEKQIVEERLNETRKGIPLMTEDMVMKYLLNVQQTLNKRDNPAACRKIINDNIAKIIIYPDDTFKVVYKFDTNKFGYDGSPKGNRTPVSAVRGRHPRPLDDGAT